MEEELQHLTPEQLVTKYCILRGLYLAQSEYVKKLEWHVDALWDRIEFLHSQTLQSELDKIKERLAALEQQQNP
jgi:hypothetical protein